MILFFLGFGCVEPDKERQDGRTVSYEYYDAVSLITLESSGFQLEERYLVRRSLRTDLSQIFEEFYSTIDGTLVTTTMDVDLEAKRFVLSFSDDSYTGEGSFVGEGLEWTNWESEAYHVDGSFVVSTDEKDNDGIHTYKVGYGMSGEKDWSMDEQLTPLTEAEWEQAVADLPTLE